MATLAVNVANPKSKFAGKVACGQPPVIVLNLFYTGLGIARQLWGTGVRVVGLSAHPRIYGNFSRLCEVRRAPNSQENPEQLAELLLQIAKDLEGAVVFPTRDADLLFLDHFRRELQSFYRLAIPPSSVLFRVLDKSAVSQAAVDAGIPTPRSAVIRDGVQLNCAVESVGFPCVVKPISSFHWRLGNNWNRVGERKAFSASNFNELAQLYERIRTVHAEVLLQEWIPGGDDQLAIWGGHVSKQGAPIAYFTAKKIVQSPPEFGTGCVVETQLIPELLGSSLRLCHALDYSGIAEIEYKLDPRDGYFKLIEINPRLWDWHELGRACGVNLTSAAYCSLIGREIRPMLPNPRRAQWVAEDALLLYLSSRISRRDFHWLPLRISMVSRRIFGIFSWRDPIPFFRYFITTLVPRIAGAALRRLRPKSDCGDKLVINAQLE
jgi:predicted ATP-grasp superfamily ATP-dependent carboligase